ncbi:MAG: methylmalonyl-CoA mutase family protein [Alphaproteobacteria bacterium]
MFGSGDGSVKCGPPDFTHEVIAADGSVGFLRGKLTKCRAQQRRSGAGGRDSLDLVPTPRPFAVCRRRFPSPRTFPRPTTSAWRALTEKARRQKRAWEGLTGHTADGLAIAPVYSAGAVAGGVIGRSGPWDIRQIVEQRDPRTANAEVLAELNGGATSIELRVAQGASRGVQIRDASDLALALDGMMLDLAPVALDAGGDETVARLLAAYAGKRGVKDAPLAFNRRSVCTAA